MAVRRLAPAELQPMEFSFSMEKLAWANNHIEK